MMVGPIVTSALLMDLAEVAFRENMTPLDPLYRGPEIIPAEVHSIHILRLDGSIEKVVPDIDPDWSTIAAARFEDALGTVIPCTYDPDAEDWEDEDEPVVVAGDPTAAPDQPRLTPGA